MTYDKDDSLLKKLTQAFINPFTLILIALVVVSAITDIILAAPGEKDPMTVLVIITMVLISGVLRFVQETRSVCKQVGIEFDRVYVGSDVDQLSDQELGNLAHKENVFAKISPSQKTRLMDASSVSKFMLWIGPISSVFDITTYLLMYFIISPMLTDGLLFHQLTNPKMMAVYIAVFQAGWFVEFLWSQTLVIHIIRTPKIPFIQSGHLFQ